MKKKNYIQPISDVATLQTTYSILGASKPFEYGGESPIDAEPV